MSYFKEFPKLFYSNSTGVKNFKTVTNIFSNVKFIKDVLLNNDIYYPYNVKDGERPEDIADKLYKDPTKHWVILLANNIIDPQYDWVMSQNAFEDYINKKYSSINVQLPVTASDYIVNEVVYQGDSLADASFQGQVASFNNATRVLQIKFPSQSIANATNITGVTSGQNHQIETVSLNNDGYHWAVNTTSHLQVTETRYNSYDKLKNTRTYSVSTYDYNFTSDNVVGRTLGASNTSTQLEDGTTFTVETFIGPKSFYDYEVERNESKRRIKLPKPEFITVIDQQFKRLMKTSR